MQVTGGIEVPGRPLPGGWRRSARALARVIAAASIGTALTAGLSPVHGSGHRHGSRDDRASEW